MPISGVSTTVLLHLYEPVQERAGMDLCMIVCKMKTMIPTLEQVPKNVEYST